MNFRNRICRDPEINYGHPVVKGTKIPIEMLLRKLSNGCTIGDLLNEYNELTSDDISAIMAYSAELVSKHVIIGKKREYRNR